MLDLIIRNGTIVTPQDTFAGDIAIKDGKIQQILCPGTDVPSREVYDAAGQHVFAGFIDTHVHSRDGGATYKEDFLHSTLSAACGGITTLLEMPNAVPAVANLKNLHAQKANLASKAFIDFGMWGLSVGDLNNHELPALADEGVVGFKFFWGYAIRKDTYGLIYSPKTQDENTIPPLSDGEVYRIFETMAHTGRELAIHAENASIIRELSARIRPEDFKNPYEALLCQRPVLAEVATVQLAIRMAKETGAHLHILHVSAAETVELVRRAQQEGIHVTAETCPHYLLLTADRFEEVGNMMKGYPPVRRQSDQDALWAGLRDGTLNHVCSDHAPHTKEEKQGTLADIPAGMCGIESMVPLMATAVCDGKLTMNQLAAVLSENPARQYGLYPQKGSLLPGTDADVTIIDFRKTGKVEEEKLHSVSKVTAFDGFPLKGLPVAVFLRGNLIARNGEPATEEITGKFIRAEW